MAFGDKPLIVFSCCHWIVKYFTRLLEEFRLKKLLQVCNDCIKLGWMSCFKVLQQKFLISPGLSNCLLKFWLGLIQWIQKTARQSKGPQQLWFACVLQPNCLPFNMCQFPLEGRELVFRVDTHQTYALSKTDGSVCPRASAICLRLVPMGLI